MVFSFLRRSAAAPSFQTITADQYKTQFMDAAAAHTLVDVRTVGEFREGHLPGAINIPLDLLPLQLGKIPDGQSVVVVCASGSRSRSGSQALVNAGRTQVYNLGGGTMGWMMRGYPVQRGA